MKIIASISVWDRIAQFYIDAKEKKFGNSYGWDEVYRDIELAHNDTKFLLCSYSKKEWINAGYSVVRNSRNWAFAYKIDENGNMLIFAADNCKNLTIKINQTNNLSIQDNLSSVRKSKDKPYQFMGYGWWAIRKQDGYIYIQNKNGQSMPNIRFNEIVKQFRQRKDDANIYAIGQYGGKNYKVYLNGKYVLIENKKHRKSIIRLTESQLQKIINETISDYLNESYIKRQSGQFTVVKGDNEAHSIKGLEKYSGNLYDVAMYDSPIKTFCVFSIGKGTNSFVCCKLLYDKEYGTWLGFEPIKSQDVPSQIKKDLKRHFINQ